MQSKKMKEKIGTVYHRKHASPSFDDSETQLIESPLHGENQDDDDGGDTLPYENTVLLENTVPLEDTVVLESTVPLETEIEMQLVGDGKNQKKRGLLLGESDTNNDAGDTVKAENLESDTEVKTQLLEDVQEDNVISSSKDQTHFHVVADSDDEGGGETEVLSEDDDASDGASSHWRVNGLKGNQIPVEAVPLPNSCHPKEASQPHLSDTGMGTSFNSVDSYHQLEQQSVVDSDASTEDESDVGELQQHSGLYPSGHGQAVVNCQNPEEGILSQRSIHGNDQRDDSMVFLQDPLKIKKKDGHKLTSHLVSHDLSSPETFQSVHASMQMATGLTPTGVSSGNSCDRSSVSIDRSRNIGSVRAASLRASGLRALGMLSKTKEITGVQGAKGEAVGNNKVIPGIAETVEPMENTPTVPSYPKCRAESLIARRLFSDTEAVAVDKVESGDGFEMDDKTRARTGKVEGDVMRATGGNDDQQMAMVVNGKDDETNFVFVNKENAGPAGAGCKSGKDNIHRKQASNTVNSQQLKSLGPDELGLVKKSKPHSVSAGLNYLDSQEPGEESQADALHMVDKLVWLNTTGFSQDPEPQKLPEMISHGPPTAKGPQNLAHFVDLKNPSEKIEVFDWVDSQNDEGGGQFFMKNGRGRLALVSRGSKVKSDAKKMRRRSSKGENDSVLCKEADKIGNDKSRILLQGLQKLASSSTSEYNLIKASNLSNGRENKAKMEDQEAEVTVSNRAKESHSDDTFRFSERLQTGKEQNHYKKRRGATDKQSAMPKKLLLNSGGASEQQARRSPVCRDTLDLSSIGNDTQLAAEAMQIMRSETSPIEGTEENTHAVAVRSTKLRESREGKGRVYGTGAREVSEGHSSRKLPNTDNDDGENFAKQTVRSPVTTRGKSRRVHWEEFEDKSQNKDESRKRKISRSSQQDMKEKLESKTDQAGSEASKENQDMVAKGSLKAVSRTRKGSNVEETSKPAEADARAGHITRQRRILNQGEICETETSSKNCGTGEKEDILKDSAKVAMTERRLATDDLTMLLGGFQSITEALERRQPIEETPVVHSTRQINKKKVEKQNLEIQSYSKSSKTKEEEKDALKNAATIVQNKRKRTAIEDKPYKQSKSVSKHQSSKSQPTEEVNSTKVDAEEETCERGVVSTSNLEGKSLLQERTLRMGKQTTSKSLETHDEDRDTLPDLEKAVRRKRTKSSKEETSFKLSKSISSGEVLPVESADKNMCKKVGETAMRITRQTMRNSGAEAGSISASAAIDVGDKSDLNSIVPESGGQKRKSNRRNKTPPTSVFKLANHGDLTSTNKNGVQLNDTSGNGRSSPTCWTPENVKFKSPATTGHGLETATYLSTKKLQNKGTPKSTLKRELGRLVATYSGQSPVLRDSARKRREPGSIRVLFSHSLDDDLVKQQKKILTRLGGQPTASHEDCTHFVTDKFVRTRNMLEVMVAGKPVVTHLWLENCGQASYFIDEKNYILRDDKKEKEIGFNMLGSLASAQQKPLLQDKHVFVTPNTKPDQESIISLVKAAKGQVLNGLKGAFNRREGNMESIIVISCEEDYGVCIPLLEKGAKIYSPELLLNGIVVQRLDLSRDQLFTDHVKRMRSSNEPLRQRT